MLIKAFRMGDGPFQKVWTKDSWFIQFTHKLTEDNVDDDDRDDSEKTKRRVVTDIPEDVDLSLTPMEDILEVVTGGHVKSYGLFNAKKPTCTKCGPRTMYNMWVITCYSSINYNNDNKAATKP
eukprot:scaffold15452_cov54-Cylindrotheca_fusiformis.AAC.1